MIKKYQNLGKERVNIIQNYLVVSNVVGKKLVKTVKKPQKNRKVRVNLGLDLIFFNNLQLKSEFLSKRESYNNLYYN